MHAIPVLILGAVILVTVIACLFSQQARDAVAKAVPLIITRLLGRIGL